ncbi:hypothetical protein [Dactylosporangium sp. NPDC051541]
MIVRLMGSLFAPKYPRFYTGRHRAPMRSLSTWGAGLRPHERE